MKTALAFGPAALRERATRAALRRLPFCILLYPAAAFGLCALMDEVPSAAAFLPALWQQGMAGRCALYCVVGCLLTALVGFVAPDLHRYGALRDGSWQLALQLGESARRLSRAKWASGALLPAAGYLVGGALFLGGVLLMQPDGDVRAGALTLAAGFCLTLLFGSALTLFGALGAGNGVLRPLAVLLAALMELLLLFCGFFGGGLFSMQQALVLCGAAAALFLLLSAAVCLTIPVRRASSTELEELDDTALGQLEFDPALEVYIKQKGGYELVFSGSDVAKK